MSNLFYTKEPKIVNPDLACLVGLNEAIIAQQIYWLTTGGRGNMKDGYYWVYNTYAGWQEHFPWWSVDTIKRTINRLEERGLIISSSDMNKMSIDRTKWYRVIEANFAKLSVPDHQGILPQSEKLAILDSSNLPSSIGATCTDHNANLALSHQGNLPSPITIEKDFQSKTTIDPKFSISEESFSDGGIEPPVVVGNFAKAKKPPTKKFKSVSEVLGAVEKESVSEKQYIETMLEKPITKTVLGDFWRFCLVYHQHVSFATTLTGKDIAQLQSAYVKLSGDAERKLQLIAKCIMRWSKFTNHTEETAGAFNSPIIPTIGYVLKYIQCLENWGTTPAPSVNNVTQTQDFGGTVTLPSKFKTGGVT